MINILITGGSGFIGSHIAEEFLKEKDRYNVIIVDNLSSGDLNNIKNLKIKFYNLDILDRSLLEDIFQKHEIDYVIHQAAQTSVSNSIKSPLYDAKEILLV